MERFEVKEYNYPYPMGKYGVWDTVKNCWYCLGVSDVKSDKKEDIEEICRNLNELEKYKNKQKK